MLERRNVNMKYQCMYFSLTNIELLRPVVFLNWKKINDYGG